MNDDGFIMSMIAQLLEEDSSSKQRYLQCLYVYIRSEVAPCVCAYAVRDECREKSIEVAEEEDGAVIRMSILYQSVIT